MDKKYYYRVLGLCEDATMEQIEKAYTLRISRLKSNDYADEPEYVQRKISEARYAYGVITGATAPFTEKERNGYFEKLKNAVESGEKKGLACLKKKVKLPNFSAKLDSIRFFSGVIGIMTVMSLMLSVVGVFTVDSDYMDIEEDIQYVSSNQTNNAAVERLYNRFEEYNFYGHLAQPKRDYSDMIEYSVSEDTLSIIWEKTEDLIYALDLENIEDTVGYVTGYNVDSFYDQEEVANIVAGIMAAPSFYDVAGMVNKYNNRVILTYDDYLVFLTDVAEHQTDSICEEDM